MNSQSNFPGVGEGKGVLVGIGVKVGKTKVGLAVGVMVGGKGVLLGIGVF